MKTGTLRVRNVVDATRFWVHGCEPWRVSDGSRLALCQTLSLSNAPRLSFSGLCILLFLFLSLCRFVVFVFFFCSHWSLVDVPLIPFCPADHVPDWQPRIILLGMVEARSVNVKKTTNNNKHHFFKPSVHHALVCMHLLNQRDPVIALSQVFGNHHAASTAPLKEYAFNLFTRLVSKVSIILFPHHNRRYQQLRAGLQ